MCPKIKLKQKNFEFRKSAIIKPNYHEMFRLARYFDKEQEFEFS